MIYIIAYCQNNLGDDLFVRMLVRRYPNEKFYLCASPQYTRIFRNEKNLRCANLIEYTILRLFHKCFRQTGRICNYYIFKRAKAVVQIGGSIFIERVNWEKKFSIDKHQNLFLIGCNFGPFYSNEYFNRMRDKISSAADCCFRDKNSYNLFKDIPTVRYAPDVILGLSNLETIPKNGDYVGVSVIDMSKHPDLRNFRETYECGVAKICNRWIKRGKKVRIFCFCEAEGDVSAALRIMSMVDSSSALSIHTYQNGIDVFLEELNSCEVLYATRFHAMILGWKMRKRVVPIVYSIKQKNVIDDIGYTGIQWDISQGKCYKEYLVNSIPDRIDDLVMKSLEQKAADQFLALEHFLAE